MRYRLQTRALIRLVLFAATGWVPGTVGLVLLVAGVIPVSAALGLGLAGGLVATLLALVRALKRQDARLRPNAASVIDTGQATWAAVADPRGNYANRWAMYQDLSAWLNARDWTGKAVAEFGATNEVLRSFIRGARYVLLEYPERDVQDLQGIESGQFDLAILDQTLEHVRDPERALSEVQRILKPGGVAIVTTPFLVPLHAAGSYGDFTRWTPQGLATALRRCGFDADVRWWGNLAAARTLLDDMYLTAETAMKRGIRIEPGENEEIYPVTVWALATSRK